MKMNFAFRTCHGTFMKEGRKEASVRFVIFSEELTSPFHPEVASKLSQRARDATTPTHRPEPRLRVGDPTE